MMRQKILVIDDEEDMCFFVKANLELSGKYRVNVSKNGREGIRDVFIYQPDLILLDMMMPFLNGFEVLKKLKSNSKTTSIPVIMLTAKDDEESKVKAASLYTEDYIVKPVMIETLKAKINDVLARVIKGAG